MQNTLLNQLSQDKDGDDNDKSIANQHDNIKLQAQNEFTTANVLLRNTSKHEVKDNNSLLRL